MRCGRPYVAVSLKSCALIVQPFTDALASSPVDKSIAFRNRLPKGVSIVSELLEADS
jgi:hypothetical protein